METIGLRFSIIATGSRYMDSYELMLRDQTIPYSTEHCALHTVGYQLISIYLSVCVCGWSMGHIQRRICVPRALSRRHSVLQ